MLESPLTNSPSIRTSERQAEPCPPDSDFSNNKSAPFEQKLLIRMAALRAKDGQEGHHLLIPVTNSVCSAGTQNTATYSWVLLSPSLFCVRLCGCRIHVHKLSIFDTSLPVVKNQTISIDLKNIMESLSGIAGQTCLQQHEFATDLVLGTLCLLRVCEKWHFELKKTNLGWELSPGRHFYSLPSKAVAERALGHAAKLKSTIISKATILPGCWQSKWGSVTSPSKTLYCFKHHCVYFTPSHSLCKETLRDKQEAWIVARSLPEFPNISYFGPRDEFSLQTT